jgi:serine phosphatase RsbU (regulator of sigma subunit)
VSQPEDVLDLLPDRERDEQRQEDEAEQKKEKADARTMRLALVFVACAPFCPRVRQPAFDRVRVDGRVVRRGPMRGWGADGRTMLTLLRRSATGSRGAKAHNAFVRGVAYEREEALLESVSRAARGLLQDRSLPEALDLLAEAAATATGSDLVIVRTLSRDDHGLVARAVHSESAALAAELEGSRLGMDGLDWEEVESATSSSDETLPAAIRNVAARARAETMGIHPVRVGENIVGTLELYRTADAPFEERERMLGRLAAAHVGIAIRLEVIGRTEGASGRTLPLELLGEALVAGADEAETAEQVVRLATLATGAAGAALWRVEADAPPSFLARHGFNGDAPDHGEGSEDVEAALADRQRALVTRRSSGANGSGASVATIPLGEPPVGALQLYFESEPSEDDLALLVPFSARAALALRRSRRVGLIATALRRSQTIIGVVSQAIAQLSLAHTLETAVERIAELTASGHVAVYLREGRRLTAAASRGLEGPHTDLAERLLELALGPFRGRGFLFIEDMRRDPRLKGLEDGWEANGIRRALVVPLIVHDEVIGALAVYKTRARAYREGEESLLLALSSQLAVAVENARLHERTKELGEVLEATLDSERRSTRQLRGLYEISASFSESLSLEATLEAVAKTMVQLFDLDAAVIRMPSARGEVLEPKAIYVGDSSLRDTAERLLALPQPMEAPLARRLLRSGRPVLLEPGMADGMDAHRTLEPFLAQGGTAAVLPLATPGEVLGTLTLLSLDPARPIERETVEVAMTVAGQAALAIDNARLYQQQKDFSETMQRSLLPSELPDVGGIEVGHVYQSAARVDVGGDVYDFLRLDDGRLAVILGDVTGKGIQAAADMAMAKFSFRALARMHPEPGDFLAAVNEVVVDEIETGKFITMLYVLLDPEARSVASSSAGHPAARVVTADGQVGELGGHGLALGIDSDQEYEVARDELAPGTTVVLYTDGVLEARRDGELYGEERLDDLLHRRAGLGPQELADAVLADCRSFAGGELSDDCAVVCLRLLP